MRCIVNAPGGTAQIDAYAAKAVLTRKSHDCRACGSTVWKLAVAYSVFGRWEDGKPEQFYLHGRCAPKVVEDLAER